jgi:lipopolysaccharide transport system ATP-binding protein
VSDVVITVEHLSKRYVIGRRGETVEDRFVRDLRGRNFADDGLRHVLERAVRAPFVWLRSGSVSKRATLVEFWALRDVGLTVRTGEVVGIIGRNGAGKSTLLKILSRITEPTAGNIRIRGRVASLLEVGTGFHPELTGRENIYLNGAILGMSRMEIARRFDEIVSFAEVEKFLDTPVKHYSSGMRVRLGFAVAAHLEPEILVVDEVLAVGDTFFQKKCIDRMTEVGRSGRTVLFVTHNFSALRALCSRAIVLRAGEVVFDGPVEESLQTYQPTMTASGHLIDLMTDRRRLGARQLVFERIAFKSMPLHFGEPLQFKLRLHSKHQATRFPELDLGIGIRDKEGNYVIHCSNRFTNTMLEHDADEREYVVDIENFLKPNTYFMTLFVRSRETVQDWLTDVVTFEIADGNPYGYYRTPEIQGATLPRFSIHKQ